MNADRLLAHLFSLARRAPASPGEMPYGLEMAVLAHWREDRTAPRENASLLPGLRWAALGACALALLLGALKRDEVTAFNNRYDPETRVADSAIAAVYDNQ